jgi:ubiquinone/menaquinone biosynthesis C-methylase UbiE
MNEAGRILEGVVVTDAGRRFDRWAERYEEDPISRWLARLQQQAVDALTLHESDRLLDVGCGTGAAVRHAAEVAERAEGVDLSEAMIARARTLAGDLPNVSFEVTDASRLPFEDGRFTAVLCTTSFHHYAEPQAAVHEMARVLEPGGRIAIGDGVTDRILARAVDALNRAFDSEHVRMYRVAELGGFLRSAGFDDVEWKRLVRGGYAIVRATKR